MVQLISFIVPKDLFVNHYTEPSRKALAELEVDFKGVSSVVDSIKEQPELSVADAVHALLEFGGIKAFNALLVSEAREHVVLRLRASRKKGNQWANLVRRSIGVGVHTGYIDITTATSMPGLPRSSSSLTVRTISVPVCASRPMIGGTSSGDGR